MKVGIVGLSSAGKSTLFQLLTGAAAPPPGGRPEPRLGIARVPDDRVEQLASLFNPKKKTFATVEYVDVPGVAKGEGRPSSTCPRCAGSTPSCTWCGHSSRTWCRTPTARWIRCATPACWSWS